MARANGSFTPTDLSWKYPMIRYFFRKIFIKNKNLFFQEAHRITGFLELFMKQRNTGVKWTKEEKAQLKAHLKHLSMYIPILIIFILPFGSLLVPILAEIYDRRKKRRDPGERGEKR